jgi:hypothetical protein
VSPRSGSIEVGGSGTRIELASPVGCGSCAGADLRERFARLFPVLCALASLSFMNSARAYRRIPGVEDDVISAHKNTAQFMPTKELITFFCTHSRHSYPSGLKFALTCFNATHGPGCGFAERGAARKHLNASRSNELNL